MSIHIYTGAASSTVATCLNRTITVISDPRAPCLSPFVCLAYKVGVTIISRRECTAVKSTARIRARGPRDSPGESVSFSTVSGEQKSLGRRAEWHRATLGHPIANSKAPTPKFLSPGPLPAGVQPDRNAERNRTVKLCRTLLLTLQTLTPPSNITPIHPWDVLKHRRGASDTPPQTRPNPQPCLLGVQPGGR